MPRPRFKMGDRCSRNHVMTTETLRTRRDGRQYCGKCNAITENLRWHKKKRDAQEYVARWT